MSPQKETRESQQQEAFAVLQLQVSTLTGRSQAIAQALVDKVHSHSLPLFQWLDSRGQDRKTPDLHGLLWGEKDRQLKDIFRPGSDEYNALVALIGEDNARRAKGMWDRSSRYPCFRDYGAWACRPQHDTAPYFLPALSLLIAYLKALNDGFSLERYLDMHSSRVESFPFQGETQVIPRLIALELEQGREEAHTLLDRLRHIVTDEAGEATLTPEIIAGLLQSDDDGALELVSNLMRAARLAEGLRAAILAQIPYASPKGFVRLMELIHEENLGRFTSVSKAFAWWVGLAEDGVLRRKHKEFFSVACQCLTDTNYRKECLAGDHPLRLYLALWATARTSIEEAEEAIRTLLADERKPVCLTALIALSKCPLPRMQYALVRPYLDNPVWVQDEELLAWLFQCLGSVKDFKIMRTPDGTATPLDKKPLYALYNRTLLTPPTVREIYLSLRSILVSFGPREKTRHFIDSPFAGVEVYCSPSRVVELMRRLLSRKSEKIPGYQPDPPEGYCGPVAACKQKWGLHMDWMDTNFQYRDVLDVLDHITIEADGEQRSLRDDLCALTSRMDAEERHGLIENILGFGLTPVQRKTLISFLAGADEYLVRRPAWRYAMASPFTAEELQVLEGYLRLKNEKIRQPIYLKLYLELGDHPDKLEELIGRLLTSKEANKRQAGMEMLAILTHRKDDPAYAPAWERLTMLAAGKDQTPRQAGPQAQATESSQERSTSSTVTTSELPGLEVQGPFMEPADPPDGLGLYSPHSPEPVFSLENAPEAFNALALFGTTDLEEPVRIFRELMIQMNAEFMEHRHMRYTVKTWEGLSQEAVLGAGYQVMPFLPEYRTWWTGGTLDNYPLADTWRRIRNETGVTYPLLALLAAQLINNLSFCREREWLWLREKAGAGIILDVGQAIRNFLQTEKPPFESQVRFLLPVLAADMLDPENGWKQIKEYYSSLRHGLAWLLQYTPRPGREEECHADYVRDWFSRISEVIWNPARQEEFRTPHPAIPQKEWDTLFRDYFRLRYLYLTDSRYRPGWIKSAVPLWGLEYMDPAFLAHAFRLELLNREDMARLLVRMGLARHGAFARLTSPLLRPHLVAVSPSFLKLLDSVILKAVEVEKKRGELPTPVSLLAGQVLYVPGMEQFLDLLELAGREGMERGAWEYAVPGRRVTRRQMFSHLLFRTFPCEGEDEGRLNELLTTRPIDHQLLLDGAMLAPQWVETVAAYLGWPGLESAYWYFQAHVNTRFSAEKETMVACYSTITPQEFHDGAFDFAWFHSALAQVGEERFEKLYQAARYAAGGSSHQRALLFTDAIRGRLDKGAVQERIRKQRTQTYVLAYALLPLDSKNPQADALERYEFFQRFLKEGRNIKGKKRVNEARCVEVALANLARNAGYGEPERFVWAMEGQKLRSYAPYLEPQTLEGTEGGVDIRLWMEMGEHGKTTLGILKNGKPQKSLPAAYKKHPYVQDLMEACATVKEQYSRARFALERAMILQEPFTVQELRELAASPLLSPLVNTLVFMTQQEGHPAHRGPGSFGFISHLLEQNPKGNVWIAHPSHLYRAGVWTDWQRTLFDQHLVQPFKQVFRELYLPTQEEKQHNHSTRYAGREVQVARGAAMMRSRGWSSSFYAGMQKVYLSRDLLALLQARADWGNLEGHQSPLLEDVIFLSRSTREPLLVEDVPEHLFSEVMRDIDMLVSVAHAGGVDVEASASTLEIRQIIAAEAIRLFKLHNVRLEGARAWITGVRGEYTVHLGSGTVQRIGHDALALSTVAENRDRIFLPFADEDPMTAEVVAKILLLAEDGKIKDPSLLQQLA